MANKCFKNEIDLFYDTESGSVSEEIRMGCNWNSIITISMFTVWVMHREQEDYYMINEKGLKIKIDEKTTKWFGGLI